MLRAVVAVLTDTAEPHESASISGDVLSLRPDDDAAWRRIAQEATHALLLGEPVHELQARHHGALAADLGLAVARRSALAGPLGLLVAARSAVDALRGADAALAVGLLPTRVDEALARMWNGAWVPGVSRLDRPAPSIWQHLRSWLPGGEGYLVTLGADPRVESVARATEAAWRAPQEPPAPPVRGVLATAGELPDAARTLALARSGAAGSGPVPPGAEQAAARFGPGAVELVALPTVAADRPAGRLATCPVCTAAVPEGFCPYCRVRPAIDPDPVGAHA